MTLDTTFLLAEPTITMPNGRVRGALYSNPFDCLWKTLKTEGFFGWYKGQFGSDGMKGKEEYRLIGGWGCDAGCRNNGAFLADSATYCEYISHLRPESSTLIHDCVAEQVITLVANEVSDPILPLLDRHMLIRNPLFIAGHGAVQKVETQMRGERVYIVMIVIVMSVMHDIVMKETVR